MATCSGKELKEWVFSGSTSVYVLFVDDTGPVAVQLRLSATPGSVRLQVASDRRVSVCSVVVVTPNGDARAVVGRNAVGTKDKSTVGP